MNANMKQLNKEQQQHCQYLIDFSSFLSCHYNEDLYKIWKQQVKSTEIYTPFDINSLLGYLVPQYSQFVFQSDYPTLNLNDDSSNRQKLVLLVGTKMEVLPQLLSFLLQSTANNVHHHTGQYISTNYQFVNCSPHQYHQYKLSNDAENELESQYDENIFLPYAVILFLNEIFETDDLENVLHNEFQIHVQNHTRGMIVCCRSDVFPHCFDPRNYGFEFIASTPKYSGNMNNKEGYLFYSFQKQQQQQQQQQQQLSEIVVKSVQKTNDRAKCQSEKDDDDDDDDEIMENIENIEENIENDGEEHSELFTKNECEDQSTSTQDEQHSQNVENIEEKNNTKTFASVLKSILNIPSSSMNTSDVVNRTVSDQDTTSVTYPSKSTTPSNNTTRQTKLFHTPHRKEDGHMDAANLRVFGIKSSFDFPEIDEILKALYNDDVLPYYRHKSFTTEFSIKFGTRIHLTEADKQFLNTNKNNNENITSLWKTKLDSLHKNHFFKLNGNRTYCNVNHGEKNCDVFFDDTFSKNDDSCFFMIRIFRKKN